MFRNILASTPLTSDAANAYFADRIYGSDYSGDTSFLATLRALLDPRMKEGDSVYLSFGSSTYGADTLGTNPVETLLNATAGDYANTSNIIRIHHFRNSSQAANTAWMDFVKEHFEKQYPGWRRVEKFTEFYRKVFGVHCFVNPEKRSAILCVDNFGIRQMHYLQCGVVAFLPWYFDPESGVSEQEMELIQSLREKTSERYELCIAQIAQRYDFKTARVRQLLGGFELRYERMQRDQIQRQLEHCITQINSLNDRIGQFLTSQRDYENQLFGLDAKLAQDNGDSEIMEYFLCNDHLVLEDVSDTTMAFAVRDYLTYFDEEMARTVIDNPTSYIYRPDGSDCERIIPKEDMKRLMKAIFLDQTLRVRFCAAYSFRLEGNVSAQGNHRYGAECAGYTPNPHIDRFTCLGDYSKTINQALQRRDYIGAIEQCIASCKSLNFADSAVFSEFMRRLYGIGGFSGNMNCIELPDGTVTNAKGAIAWLKRGDETDG